MAEKGAIRLRDIAARVRHPPLREAPFWVVQFLVVIMAGIHIFIDLQSSSGQGSFPTGLPVGLLLIPVGYAALRYGLSGSAATATWAIVLWLPDLMLPNGRGHPDDDLVELALVLAVAIFGGVYIERERIERARSRALELEQQAAERRWATELLRAQEEERRRLSRELHDDPLQRLIQLARRFEGDGEPSSIAVGGTPGVAGAREEVLDVVGRLRDVMRGLRPAGLDDLGLVAALRSLLDDVAPLRATLDVTGQEVRLPSEVEVGLFRIAQEAVTNAVRHAAASEVAVAIDFGHDTCTLAVSDDGRGFEVADVDRQRLHHFGLVGMRERARAIEGTLEVRSKPGEGTVVTAAAIRRAVDRSSSTTATATTSPLA